MLKSDGSVLVHADSGGYKPLNWMTPPTVIEEDGDRIVVRKRAERTEDRLEIHLVEVLSDVDHEMGEAAALEKDGVESQLQAELAAQPEVSEADLTLVRREWPTDIGPVDLMCRDAEGGWVAVEIKQIGTIEAVEQLSRYLEYIRVDPARAQLAGNPRSPVDQAAGGEARRVAWTGLRGGRPRAPAWRARARADALRLSYSPTISSGRTGTRVNSRPGSRHGAPT